MKEYSKDSMEEAMIDKKLKIAFDIGGVISKYPDEFLRLYTELSTYNFCFFITDMHDKEEVMKTLNVNNFFPNYEEVYCADYKKYGEMCKAVLLAELEIDMFFDDFIGYLAWDSSLGPAPIRLLVMPDPYKPYWSPEWKVNDNFDFGRRKYTK